MINLEINKRAGVVNKKSFWRTIDMLYNLYIHLDRISKTLLLNFHIFKMPRNFANYNNATYFYSKYK